MKDGKGSIHAKLTNLSHPFSIFCKIIAGKIPSKKLYETEKTFAFLDIGPIAPKHCLVIPKYHGAKLTDIPDEHLQELLPIAKKLAKASGAEQYNILQNNGRLAHQQVDHVHCMYSWLVIACSSLSLTILTFSTCSPYDP